MYDECLGGGIRNNASIGSVVGFDEDHDIVVLYPSGNRWTFNAALLSKVEGVNILSMSSIASSSNSNTSALFSQRNSTIRIGSIVKISRNIELVRRLQKNHGEWADAMTMVRLIINYLS